MIQLAELFFAGEPARLRLARQAGITHAVMKLLPRTEGMEASGYPALLRAVKAELDSAGLAFAGVESHPVPAEKIKLGLPGRDEEIENYIAMIRALAGAGVPMLCYNWMAGLGWYRTRVDAPARGGALVSEFDSDTARAQGPTEFGEISEDAVWANLEYFLAAVLPVARQCGVRMALHPDDPPVSPLRGIGRILTSAESFRRVLAFSGSESNGIAFCQATFRLMGEDVEALAREWRERIYFVHMRAVEGARGRFRETFHDNRPAEFVRMLRVCHDAGFSGPLRPDHAPTLEGEANDRPGYAVGGKILAIGYLKGIMDALGIPYAR